jgi:hypothetical protein
MNKNKINKNILNEINKNIQILIDNINSKNSKYDNDIINLDKLEEIQMIISGVNI